MQKKILLFSILFITNSVFAQNLDINILKNINVGRNKKLDNSFQILGKSVAPINIAFPITIVAVGLINNDRITTNKGICIGASLLLASGITTGLKYTIKRPRPFVTYPFIEQATSVRDPSFPSGHTTSAFAVATSLTLAYQKWYVAVPSYLWASSVAYSRMHLGVHYFSDVLVGAIVGSGSAFLCYKLNRLIIK